MIPDVKSPKRRRRTGAWLLLLAGACIAGGCGKPLTTPRLIYPEGSGWFGSAGSVRTGLRGAGYRGAYERFTWSLFFTDHFTLARSRAPAKLLANRIEALARTNPRGRIDLVGLSAGTAVLLNALEELPDDVFVQHVALLSSSASSHRDLTKAMQHVRGKLYNTVSPHDQILAALVLNADGGTSQPAGQKGFVLPPAATDEQRNAYRRVINLPWRADYLAFDWDGGHVGVTEPEFVRAVIGPRMLTDELHPLDRPVVMEE